MNCIDIFYVNKHTNSFHRIISRRLPIYRQRYLQVVKRAAANISRNVKVKQFLNLNFPNSQ